MTVPQAEPERINTSDRAVVAHWAQRLDVSVEQLQEAVQTVGDKLSDVEMHLKGSHSIANAERVQAAGGAA